MKKDISWGDYFKSEKRFADFLNACGCGGRQYFSPEDISEMDSRNTYQRREEAEQTVKYRDVVRKVALGTNFAIIGLENQEYINYALPVTCMSYDAGEYDKQRNSISKMVRDEKRYRNRGEFLYGFLKESRLHPVITFVLYSGENWDGPKELADILDYTGMPDFLRDLVQNYKVNLIDIRNWEDTSVFKTDLRQVFDCIRYSKDKKKLTELILTQPEYKELSADAVNVIQKYAKIEIKNMDEYSLGKGEKMNMCKAMEDWAAEERAEGKAEGLEEGEMKTLLSLVSKKVLKGKTPEEIAEELEIDIHTVELICDVIDSASSGSTQEELLEILLERKQNVSVC